MRPTPQILAQALADPIDETRVFTIQAVGEPLASIAGLKVHNATTGILYDVLAGQIPQASPGDSLSILVTARNDGVDGNIFINIIEADTGVVLGSQTFFVVAGESANLSVAPVTMPPRDYNIVIEVGH